MVNKVILIGRVGRDPEMRYSQQGTAMCNFNLATTEKYTNKQGEKIDETEWHRLNAFGRTAEVIGEYIHKGSLIYVEGKLKTREWQDKDGVKRSTTEIKVERMQMLSGKKDQTAKEEAPAQAPDVPDDDIPF